MPDNTDLVETETETTLTPDTEKVDGEVYDPARAMRLIEKLRGEIKELKPKAKAAEELTAAEKQRKEAEMSETDKLKAELAETRKALKEQTRRELRRAAAETVGLPLAFAERLVGETPEELETDAKKLLEALPKAPKPKPLGATNPGTGASPAGETDLQKLNRIHGGVTNPWDVPTFLRKGGGVIVNEPKTE